MGVFFVPKTKVLTSCCFKCFFESGLCTCTNIWPSEISW